MPCYIYSAYCFELKREKKFRQVWIQTKLARLEIEPSIHYAEASQASVSIQMPVGRCSHLKIIAQVIGIRIEIELS